MKNYDSGSEVFLEMQNELIKIDKTKIISMHISQENNLKTFKFNFTVNLKDLEKRFCEIDINKFNEVNFCINYLSNTYPKFTRHLLQEIKDMERLKIQSIFYRYDINYEIELIIKEF